MKKSDARCNFAIFSLNFRKSLDTSKNNPYICRLQILLDMDYTKLPRELVFRDRHSLPAFGLAPESLNGRIFERMQELTMFKDMANGDECALRCLNNAYYICTLMLNDFTARLRIKLYIDMALEKDKWEYSYDAQALTMGIVYILLKASGAEKRLLDDLFNSLESFEWCNNGARFSFLDMVYKFSLEGCFLNFFDVSPRPVDEMMQSDECLKKFIGMGSDLMNEYFEKVCTSDEQRLRLIARTLELEKEKYGFFDARISAGYHTLYAWRHQLSGEAIPYKLPCDIQMSPPLSPMYSVKTPISSPAVKNNKVEALEKEVEKLKAENENLRQMITNRPEIEDVQRELQYAQSEIERLELDLDGKSKEDKGIVAHQAAIFITTIIRKTGQMPNRREALAPVLQLLWGFTENTSKKALRRAFTPDEADKLAKEFEPVTPKLARYIKELPKEIDEENKQRLKEQNKKG